MRARRSPARRGAPGQLRMSPRTPCRFHRARRRMRRGSVRVCRGSLDPRCSTSTVSAGTPAARARSRCDSHTNAHPTARPVASVTSSRSLACKLDPNRTRCPSSATRSARAGELSRSWKGRETSPRLSTIRSAAARAPGVRLTSVVIRSTLAITSPPLRRIRSRPSGPQFSRSTSPPYQSTPSGAVRTVTVRRCEKSWNDSHPPSRPLPLSRTPPHGAAGSSRW